MLTLALIASNTNPIECATIKLLRYPPDIENCLKLADSVVVTELGKMPRIMITESKRIMRPSLWSLLAAIDAEVSAAGTELEAAGSMPLSSIEDLAATVASTFNLRVALVGQQKLRRILPFPGAVLLRAAAGPGIVLRHADFLLRK